MKAIRQLVVDAGNIPPQGEFETTEDEALFLESRGLATRVRQPVSLKSFLPPENKMMAVPQNKAKAAR
jgi:hypothetical protein